MKKHLFLLPCMFGISAVLLTACTGRDNENTVTQEITTTQETLAAGASGTVTVTMTAQKGATPGDHQATLHVSNGATEIAHAAVSSSSRRRRCP